MNTTAYQAFTENEPGEFTIHWGPAYDTKEEAENYAERVIDAPYSVRSVDLQPGTILFIAREKGIGLNDIERINKEILSS